ncbi:MAG TPA: GNAT family N-acetyltransferase [Anaerolineales bacterium]|nr:GNAT family N-acetyltransferase [Anaerolineales bacterium]
MAAGFQVREFHFPDDFDSVLGLWKSIEKGVHVGRSDTLSEIQKKIRRDPDLFLVAEQEGSIVGSVLGGFDGRRGLIYHLAVAAPSRGMGIGSQLMEAVEARLRAKGCLKCYLLVTTDNADVGQYYRQRGWYHMQDIHLYGKELQ